jgi:4-hydroxy-3-methylbut-2-enyl diphosphate reductase
MEIGASRGVPSYLVDGAGELKRDWFDEAETVVVTAGASAPEVVVKECIEFLQSNFSAEVSEETLREEHVHFATPRELMTLKAVPSGSQG